MDSNQDFQMLRFMYNFCASNRHSQVFKTHLRSLAQLLGHSACGAWMLLWRPNTLKHSSSNQALGSTLLQSLHIPILVHPEYHHRCHCLRSWAVQIKGRSKFWVHPATCCFIRSSVQSLVLPAAQLA